MISEYAVAPEAVAAWGGRDDFRYFYEAFGVGTGRAVCRFPGKWARRVLAALETDNDIERKRVEELIVRLAERMTTRSDAPYDGTQTWLSNACREHARSPFRAVIALENPGGESFVLAAGDIGPEAESFAATHDLVIPKRASDLAAVFAPLGCCARALIL